MSGNLDEQIEEVAQAEKNIASIQWKENQKYLFTYSDDDKEIYECTSVSGNDIYLQKILNAQERLYGFGNSEVNVREVIFSDTKVDMID